MTYLNLYLATTATLPEFTLSLPQGQTDRVQNGVAKALIWNHKNRLVSVTVTGINESYLYDADRQRVKKTSTGNATYYPNQFYEYYGGTVDKYYYFNGQPIALRRNGTLYYLHQDQIGNMVLATGGGAQIDVQGFYAYGRLRSGGIGVERSFTGQQRDFSSGLIYFDARYYDPELGTFISPDTLVPDATNLFDYNRYMYVRGNPLRYSDPTGHFTDDEIINHFGCENWSCVEANFQEGGSHAGMWGWLDVLRYGESGDSVDTLVLYDDGGAHITGQFALQGGKIFVNQMQMQFFTGSPSNITSAWQSSDAVTEAAFANFSSMYSNFAGHQAFYGYRGGSYSYYGGTGNPDCAHHDCVTQALDAGSTGAATIAAYCTAVGAAPCAGAAGITSTALGVIGTGWTMRNMIYADADLADVVVAGSTTYLGAKLHPYAGPFVSAYQWWLDSRSE